MNIYDIAREAGVSIATVSRVINKPEAVNIKTREKVLEIMNSKNFAPKLGTSVQRPKEMAFYTSAQSLLVEGSIIAGISEVTFAERMGLKLCPLEDIPKKPSELDSYFAEQGIGCAIFTTPPYSEEHYAHIASVIPSVLLYNRLKTADVSCIRADHHKGGYAAIQHLATMSHTDIAIVDEFKSPDHHDRLAGAREAAAAYGLPDFNEERLINVTELSELDMCAQIDHYLMRYPSTTALFVANDNFVPALYRHFRARGIRIPDDLSVIGADDVPGSADLFPPLTTIRQPVKQMSMTAARHLIDILHGTTSQTEPVREVFEVQLIVRASTRKLEIK
ncbi:LacI family DNA-binding transcriptional regulator [Paenibacillus sp. GCM10027626]|uniref:LacI family DNA-binding transcriptional regulator n=1 Tax=Paenibacillus sp. GCM10027626 TaxID=3273411 RepID=UPI003638B83C